jgi:hypothetical protein
LGEERDGLWVRFALRSINVWGAGLNATHFTSGGKDGYSSGKASSRLKTPPSQSVPSFPGMVTSHFMRFDDPSGDDLGLATNPKG